MKANSARESVTDLLLADFRRRSVPLDAIFEPSHWIDNREAESLSNEPIPPRISSQFREFRECRVSIPGSADSYPISLANTQPAFGDFARKCGGMPSTAVVAKS